MLLPFWIMWLSAPSKVNTVKTLCNWSAVEIEIEFTKVDLFFLLKCNYFCFHTNTAVVNMII